MAFLVSPGVQIQERDVTNVVPAVATAIGAYAGPFRWGPLLTPVTVSTETDLINNFFKPDAAHAVQWQTAASFLKYGNTLKVTRSIQSDGTVNQGANAVATYITGASATYSGSYVVGPGTTASSAGITTSGIQIGNLDQFNSLSATALAPVSTNSVTFIARYPGALGNSIGAYVITAQTSPNDTYAKLFDYIPSYNSNNPSVVKAVVASLATASGTSILTVPTSSFTTVTMTNSLYVIGNSIATQSAVTISSVVVSGSNYTITLGSPLISAVTTTSQFTFFEPDEVHVGIIDLDGTFTGVAGTLLEKWQNLSLYTDSKRIDGTNNYYRDYINRNSSYVYANTLAAEITGSDVSRLATTYLKLPNVSNSLAHVLGQGNALGLTGPAKSAGYDGSNIGASGDIATALNSVFSDGATIDLSLIFCGETMPSWTLATPALTTAEQAVQAIASARKDAVGFISAPLNIWQQTTNAGKQAAVLAKFSDASATRDSYSVFDSTPLYIYNKFQDNYLWIPACGHMAGLCANTDSVADTWYSPAGYNRGNLKQVTKLAYNADQAGRDALYQSSINPIVSFPGQGILLYGDKTSQSKPSAFDRINVRRLFIILEKAIATAAKYQLFELNDQFTQAMFRNMVEPFLRDIQGRRGITDFLVVCDSTNNTGAIVDANQFVADIYIKPARSINFITLNFIATRTGVAFTEVAGTTNA